MTQVADETLGMIARRLYEIFRRVREGTLNAHAVGRALQDIIENRMNPMKHVVPRWWVNGFNQHRRATQLWPGLELPPVPSNFERWTASEVLLLHVPDTFESLCEKVVVSDPDIKENWEGFRSIGERLRVTPNKIVYTEPVWLAFDPEHGRGESAESLRGLTTLAASEVLSAMIQFPDWWHDWYVTGPTPQMAGYEFDYVGQVRTFSLDRVRGPKHGPDGTFGDRLALRLNATLTTQTSPLQSVPTVRAI